MSSEAVAVGMLSNDLKHNVPVADPVMTNRSSELEQAYRVCTLCNRNLNSDIQAQAHFSGISHLTEMHAQGLPLPPDTDLTKLQRASAKAAKQQGLSRSHWHYQLPYHLPVSSYQLAVQNPLPNGESVQVLICQLCNVSCNSDKQVQAHYAGRKHQTKMHDLHKAAKIINYGQLPVASESNQIPAAAHPVSLSSSEMLVPLMPYFSGSVPSNIARNFQQQQGLGVDFSQFPSQTQPAQKRRRGVISCRVCLQVFNSESQANAHFHGVPHQKKHSQLSAFMQAASIPNQPRKKTNGRSLLMCVECHVTVNSARQMALHEQGRVHQNRLKERCTCVVPVSNEVTLSAMFEPANENSAVDSVGPVQMEVELGRSDGTTPRIISQTSSSTGV